MYLLLREPVGEGALKHYLAAPSSGWRGPASAAPPTTGGPWLLDRRVRLKGFGSSETSGTAGRKT